MIALSGLFSVPFHSGEPQAGQIVVALILLVAALAALGAALRMPRLARYQHDSRASDED